METQDRKVYVASSWKNHMQIAVVAGLRACGMSVYDFRHPEGPDTTGFAWKDVALTDPCTPDEYLKGIKHPTAIHGYERDMAAMRWANTFVLVLPCGRSAHLELGWGVGHDRETFILLDDPTTPDLMYRMVTGIAPSFFDLMGMMGVKD